MTRLLLASAWLATASGCVGVAPHGKAPAAGPGTQSPEAAESTGSLRSEQITVELRDGPLLLRLTPLDERVLRLTAPDTERRLRLLAEADRLATSPRSALEENSLFLVSFASAEADARFEPTAVALEVAGQRLRPSEVHALTPGWSDQRLRPRAAESAIYVFERRIDPFLPFTLYYGAASSERWRGVIPLLRAEQAKQGGSPPDARRARPHSSSAYSLIFR